jgi:hypothetical protein
MTSQAANKAKRNPISSAIVKVVRLYFASTLSPCKARSN